MEMGVKAGFQWRGKEPRRHKRQESDRHKSKTCSGRREQHWAQAEKCSSPSLDLSSAVLTTRTVRFVTRQISRFIIFTALKLSLSAQTLVVILTKLAKTSRVNYWQIVPIQFSFRQESITLNKRVIFLPPWNKKMIRLGCLMIMQENIRCLSLHPYYILLHTVYIPIFWGMICRKLLGG